jgi:hypothetical protein
VRNVFDTGKIFDSCKHRARNYTGPVEKNFVHYMFDKTMITNKQPKRVSPKKDTIRFLLFGLALMLASISAAFLFIPESFQSGRTIQYKQAIVPQYGVILMWTVVLFIVGGICVSNSITILKRHKTSHRTNQVTLRDDPHGQS